MSKKKKTCLGCIYADAMDIIGPHVLCKLHLQYHCYDAPCSLFETHVKLTDDRFPVYSDDRNNFFSDYSKRQMGVNCDVVLNDGTVVFNSIQPANDYIKKNLKMIGYIKSTQ